MIKPAPLTISVVTPSYKQPQWLRLCAASVADQIAPGLIVEHIVQDSLSGPEVAEVLAPFPQVKLISEKDQGMYDAINRGWATASGDILCWLNCDEQYLPGVLKDVADYFRGHPEVDVLFADAIIIDASGNYVCSRPVLTPHIYHTYTCHLQTFSCSTFFRRSFIQKHGISFDTRWKAFGDAELIIHMLRAGMRMGALRRPTSVFVETGENLALQPVAQAEKIALAKMAPRWAQVLQPLWLLQHRLRRLWNGVYSVKPFTYDIYTPASPRQRVHFDVTKPTFYWAARM